MDWSNSPLRVLFECDFCEGVFHTVRALRAHRYKVHGIQSNAEVMVDIEHVDCQMDTVNTTYSSQNSTISTVVETLDMDTAEESMVCTDSEFTDCTPQSHPTKPKQRKRWKGTFNGKKRKKKKPGDTKKTNVGVKKRRLGLDNKPACFEIAGNMENGTEDIANKLEHFPFVAENLTCEADQIEGQFDNIVENVHSEHETSQNNAEDIDNETGNVSDLSTRKQIDVLMSIYGDEDMNMCGTSDAHLETKDIESVSDSLESGTCDMVGETESDLPKSIVSKDSVSPQLRVGQNSEILSSSILGSLPSDPTLVSSLCEQDSLLTEPYEETAEIIPEQFGKAGAQSFKTFHGMLQTRSKSLTNSKISHKSAIMALDDYHYYLLKDEQVKGKQKGKIDVDSLASNTQNELRLSDKVGTSHPRNVCQLTCKQNDTKEQSRMSPVCMLEKEEANFTAWQQGNKVENARTKECQNMEVRDASNIINAVAPHKYPATKVRNQETPRTKTKARLKRNLRRSPSKVNRSLLPFRNRQASLADSPPHLIPIFAIPPSVAHCQSSPRVPKVRLKRTNSTEFKAYVIPSEEDEDHKMPSLEIQDHIQAGSPFIDNESSILDPEIPPLLPLAYKMQVSELEILPCVVPSNQGDLEQLNQLELVYPPELDRVTNHSTDGVNTGVEADAENKNHKLNIDVPRHINIKSEDVAPRLTRQKAAMHAKYPATGKNLMCKDDAGAKYICQFCSKVYTTRRHYVIHESKHKGGQVYQCDSCDFTTVGKQELGLHYRKEHQYTASMARRILKLETSKGGDDDAHLFADQDTAIPNQTFVARQPTQKTKKPSSPWLQKKRQHKRVLNKKKMLKNAAMQKRLSGETDCSITTNLQENPGAIGLRNAGYPLIPAQNSRSPPSIQCDNSSELHSKEMHAQTDFISVPCKERSTPDLKTLQVHKKRTQKRLKPVMTPVNATPASSAVVDPYAFDDFDDDPESMVSTMSIRSCDKASAKSTKSILHSPVYRKSKIKNKSDGCFSNSNENRSNEPQASTTHCKSAHISDSPEISNGSKPPVNLKVTSEVQCVASKRKKKNFNKLFNHRTKRRKPVGKCLSVTWNKLLNQPADVGASVHSIGGAEICVELIHTPDGRLDQPCNNVEKNNQEEAKSLNNVAVVQDRCEHKRKSIHDEIDKGNCLQCVHELSHSFTHDKPACTEHDKPACTEHDTPACTEHDKPACTEHDKPACTEHDKPACTEHDKPACTEHDTKSVELAQDKIGPGLLSLESSLATDNVAEYVTESKADKGMHWLQPQHPMLRSCHIVLERLPHLSSHKDIRRIATSCKVQLLQHEKDQRTETCSRCSRSIMDSKNIANDPTCAEFHFGENEQLALRKESALKINQILDYGNEKHVATGKFLAEISQDDVNLSKMKLQPGIDVLKEMPLTTACRKITSEAVNQGDESPERRRPGLVHRRNLILDDDADDDIGYHSSGSLDQVSHDESHDWFSSSEAPMIQISEMKNFKFGKEPEGTRFGTSEKYSSRSNIRSFMDALFQTTEPSDDDSEARNVKKEQCNENCGNIQRTFLEPLQSVSDAVILDPNIKVKEEPTDVVQDGKAKKAVSSLMAKFGKIKFKVSSKSPIKCKKSTLNSQISSGRAKAPALPMKNHSGRITRSQKSNLLSNRSYSGIFEEMPGVVLKDKECNDHNEIPQRKSVDPRSPAGYQSSFGRPISRSVWDFVVPDILSDPVISSMSTSMSTAVCSSIIKTEAGEPHQCTLPYYPACNVVRNTLPVETVMPRLRSTVYSGNHSQVKDEHIVGCDDSGCVCNTCNIRKKACSKHQGLFTQTRSKTKSCDRKPSLGFSQELCSTGSNCYLDNRYNKNGCLLPRNDHSWPTYTRTRMVKYQRPLAGMYRKSARQRPLVCYQPLQHILPVSSMWQQNGSGGKHSHTDDCLYGGCPV